MANGSLGEAATLKELIKQGYTVFTQFDGQSPFDMVAYRSDKLYRVSVKSTSVTRYTNSYTVTLSQHKYKRNQSFDNTSIDILAIYIIPLDFVILLDATDIKNKGSLEIKVPKYGKTYPQ